MTAAISNAHPEIDAAPQQRRAGGFDWSVDGEFAAILLDEGGLRIADWIADGRTTLVKSGAGRTIYRVQVAGFEFYVKHFKARRFTSLLHQCVAKTRARREHETAQYLRAQGVPTIRALALGERRVFGVVVESYMVTEGIRGGVTMFDVVERHHADGASAMPAKMRQALSRDLATLAAHIHAIGVEHRDLHERNVVARPVAADRFALHVLDLHDVRRHTKVPWQCARRDLTRMGRYFTLRTSRSDRLRFLKAYLVGRGMSLAHLPRLARELEAATLASRADFWRRRDARPATRSQKCLGLNFGNGDVLAGPEFPPDVLRELAAQPKRPLAENVVRMLKDGPGSRVAQINLPALGTGGTCVIKQYRYRSWFAALRNFVHPTQAERGWNNGSALKLRELPTPRPLVLVQRRHFGLVTESYLLLDFVENSADLFRHTQTAVAASDGTPGVSRGIVKGVGRLLRKLHACGVSHRDLKAANILASRSDDAAKPDLWLIDLDGMQTWLRVPRFHLVQNVARLNVSFLRAEWLTRTDRLRFLAEYLGPSAFRDGRWKAWWNAIALDTIAKIDRNARKSRLAY